MYLHNLETNRIRFRKLDLSDIDVWETFFVNNPSIHYLGLDMRLSARAQSKSWIERQLWRYENNKYGHHALILKETNEFTGQCGLLTQTIDGEEVIEIGYHVIPKYWGKGLATEAAQKIRDYAFENTISDTIVSIIDIRNIASQKVAQKNGMQIAKQTRFYGLDVYVYAITRKEWQAKHADSDS